MKNSQASVALKRKKLTYQRKIFQVTVQLRINNFQTSSKLVNKFLIKKFLTNSFLTLIGKKWY